MNKNHKNCNTFLAFLLNIGADVLLEFALL
jgi:hypothetical protein